MIKKIAEWILEEEISELKRNYEKALRDAINFELEVNELKEQQDNLLSNFHKTKHKLIFKEKLIERVKRSWIRKNNIDK